MLYTGKSGLRFTQCFCVCAAVLSTPSLQAKTVISELLYDASSADNGNVFVELFGTPGTVLDGLLLEGVNGTDGSVYISTELAGVIPSSGVFLIGDDSGDGSSFIDNTDLVREIDFQNGPDSVVLRNADTVLDAIGYGAFTGLFFGGEGNAAPDAAAGQSLARHDPWHDSNDNLSDFTVLDLPTPGAVPVSAVPVPPALGLFLSGIIGLAGVARKRSGSTCGAGALTAG
ncbi:MAG: hypothetical protein WBP44_15995 [Gammaproteobacteria bacterium]|jgi:hypothetical protein